MVHLFQIMNAEDEDVYEYLPIHYNGCIPELYVARSRLLNAVTGQRYDFWGLFCERNIRSGEFIGMYNGIWIHSGHTFEFGNRYAIELSHGMMVAPPGQRPDPQLYPIAMANEPQSGTTANAFLHEWVFGREDVENIPQDVHDEHFFGAGLVACADIPQNTEITWYYSATYDKIRDYQVGVSCAIPTHINVHPTDALGHAVPYDAVSRMLDSPSNSSSSDDPDYRSTKEDLVLKLLKYAQLSS